VRGRAIEHRQHHRLDHPVPEPPCAAQDIADAAPVAPRAGQPRQSGVFAQPGARRAAGLVQQPQRQAAVVDREVPAFPRRQIVKGKARVVGAMQRFATADSGQIARHRLIARKDEMVAIVDGLPELCIVIAAAAPPRTGRAIGEMDLDARARQFDRGGQPGEPRSDDERLCGLQGNS
jgi:hypothetical protein